MKKTILMAALLAACTSEPNNLPDPHAVMSCDAASWANQTTWPGRTITATDQCEAACVTQPMRDTTHCNAIDVRNGMEMPLTCGGTFEYGGVRGCCATTSPTNSQVDFAVCQ